MNKFMVDDIVYFKIEKTELYEVTDVYIDTLGNFLYNLSSINTPTHINLTKEEELGLFAAKHM